MIVFTKHAREKFSVLKRHGVHVTEDEVRRAIEKPSVIDHSREPLLIAQVVFDAKRVLRVVYKREGATKKVITFYPGRKKQYEKN
ncbi:MAG: DUF4258 domain-containing protein [Candidatus Yonathbacteria bacterium]|nr:DUF4258 domain-containing protein [Candidatus Yonathbacteria bacterium]